jgi:hypothetical protein
LVRVKRITPGSPNLNAYAERWVQGTKQKYLHTFVVFGQAHLRHSRPSAPHITTPSVRTRDWATDR